MLKLPSRLVALFLAVLLLSGGGTAALADAEFTPLEPAAIQAIGYTHQEWLRSSSSRSLYIVCVLVDCMIGKVPEEYIACTTEALSGNTCYVADMGTSIAAEFYGSSFNFTVYYSIGDERAYYCTSSLTSKDGDRMMNSLLNSGNYQAFYVVDGDEVYTLLSSLLEE